MTASLCAASLGVAGQATADDSEGHAASAQQELGSVAIELPAVGAAAAPSMVATLSAEERLANGELLYRAKDYDRAVIVLSGVVDKFPNTRSAADALWLRGETYYASKEYLSARRDYRALVAAGGNPSYQPFYSRALARLVDVALRVGDTASLDEVIGPLERSATQDPDALYAKGKAYFARKNYAGAQQAFAAVPPGATYAHQARYFLGLLAMRASRPTVDPARKGPPTPNYKQAIDVFRTATELPPDTPEHRHVIDLSWMAIGRLFYEMDQYQSAADAYAKVGRDSPEFDAMLYELAWTYVRLGDVQRAERALEVMSIANPNSSRLGDAMLLRADLLLRTGSFDKALKLYEAVHDEYEPARVKLDQFLQSTNDIAVYYDKLSPRELEVLDQDSSIPPIAVKWAREAEDGPLAFAVIDDVKQCRTLLRRSEQLIARLTVQTTSANRVRAFPELQAAEERVVALLNRITQARLEIARGLDLEEPKTVGGELAATRNDRRALMQRLAAGNLPVAQADFNAREESGQKQWNLVSQSLTERELEIDKLSALVNGLRRVLRDDAQRGVARDPLAVQRFTAEIDANERDLKTYREQILTLRRQIEFGRAQVGFGDARYQTDEYLRAQFRDLLDREVRLVAAGQAGSESERYGLRVAPVLLQARGLEDRLVEVFQALERKVAVRTAELRAKVDEENANVALYTQDVERLDGQARTLVGDVAAKNFKLVSDRLGLIVLRADVGITEQAWEVREEQVERVRNLQVERAREEQLLDEELREVLDDAGDQRPSSGQGTGK